MDQNAQREKFQPTQLKERVFFPQLEDINQVTQSLSSQLTHHHVLTNSFKSISVDNKKEDTSFKILSNSERMNEKMSQNVSGSEKTEVDVVKDLQLQIYDLVEEVRIKKNIQKRRRMKVHEKLIQQNLLKIVEQLKILGQKAEENSGMQQSYDQLKTEYRNLWSIKQKNKQFVINEDKQKGKINKKMNKIYQKYVFPQMFISMPQNRSEQSSPADIKNKTQNITQYLQSYHQIYKRSLSNLIGFASIQIDCLHRIIVDGQKKKKERKKYLFGKIQELQKRMVKAIQKETRSSQFFMNEIVKKMKIFLRSMQIQSNTLHYDKQDNQEEAAIDIKIVQSIQEARKTENSIKKESPGDQIQRGRAQIAEQTLQSIRIETEMTKNDNSKP